MQLQVNKEQGLAIVEDMMQGVEQKGEGQYVLYVAVGFANPQVSDQAGVKQVLTALKEFFSQAKELVYALNLKVDDVNSLDLRLAQKAEELKKLAEETK